MTKEAEKLKSAIEAFKGDTDKLLDQAVEEYRRNGDDSELRYYVGGDALFKGEPIDYFNKMEEHSEAITEAIEAIGEDADDEVQAMINEGERLVSEREENYEPNEEILEKLTPPSSFIQDLKKEIIENSIINGQRKQAVDSLIEYNIPIHRLNVSEEDKDIVTDMMCDEIRKRSEEAASKKAVEKAPAKLKP